MEGDEVWFRGRLGVVFGHLGLGIRGDSQPDDTKRGTIMKTIQVAALISLTVGSMAFGQQAVQWKVSDGGNGHWYQLPQQPLAWSDASTWATTRGAHLVTYTSSSEQDFVWASFTSQISPNPFWIGCFQEPWSCEPGCGWRWVTDEPLDYTRWKSAEPNDDRVNGNENAVCINGSNLWNDLAGELPVRFVIEWSADCNGDGIVDYGQCRDGSLPDYNGNNIPDCCETGTACVVGQYPVQWRISDGGNGHWFKDDRGTSPQVFADRNQQASAVGAHLATVTGQPEHEFVLRVAFPLGVLGPNDTWPALGGQRMAGSTQWTWVTGEPFTYAPFSPDPPNYQQTQWLMMWGHQQFVPLLWWTGNGNPTLQRAIFEWSADCNNDGIVDKGQILTGQLADSDNDGIPNVCDCPCDVFRDFNVNGIDLGILLGQWGPANQFTVTDFNGDGTVDGSDLGQLLAAWGPCPN
jgi:hypothetical protein